MRHFTAVLHRRAWISSASRRTRSSPKRSLRRETTSCDITSWRALLANFGAIAELHDAKLIAPDADGAAPDASAGAARPGIGLFIFALLGVFAILPLAGLQTKVLFNQSFTRIIQKKITKQKLLNDLYTPGFFHKTEAAKEDKVHKPKRKRSVEGNLSAVVGAAMARGALRRRNKGGAPAAAPAAAKSPAAGTSDERNPLCA